MRTLALSFFISIIFNIFLSPLSSPVARADCTTAREYITTLEFLRDQQKSLGVPEDQARKIALQVSHGCNDAAIRFIKVINLLTGSGVGGTDALPIALDFSSRSNVEADTFCVVFEKAFFPDFLDLDLRTALNMARDFSKTFQMEHPAARKDFERMIRFCLDQKGGPSTRPDCGKFAKKIASAGQKWEGEIAPSFIRTYQYLTDSDGPAMTPKDAAEVAGDSLAQGPAAAGTFFVVLSKTYLGSKKNPGLGLADAIKTAESVSSKFEGDPISVRNDFENIFAYCTSDKKLNLPGPECARTAAQIAKLGKDRDAGVYLNFVKIYEFMTSDRGPRMISGDALRLTEDILAQTQNDMDSFIQAYRYGVAKKGLAFERNDAITFAKQIALEKPSSKQER